MKTQPGHEALAELDKVLAAKPRQDGQAFSAATKALARLREEMLTGLRNRESAEKRTALGHLNAVLSIVMGGHFPLGKVPWDEIKKARGWLEEIVRTQEPGS